MSIVVSRIGRRPNRSESRPSSAVDRNCIAEKTNTRAPYPIPCAPRRWAYMGRIGSTIPKPIRSIRTVTKMTARRERPLDLAGIGATIYAAPDRSAFMAAWHRLGDQADVLARLGERVVALLQDDRAAELRAEPGHDPQPDADQEQGGCVHHHRGAGQHPGRGGELVHFLGG